MRVDGRLQYFKDMREGETVNPFDKNLQPEEWAGYEEAKAEFEVYNNEEHF